MGSLLTEVPTYEWRGDKLHFLPDTTFPSMQQCREELGDVCVADILDLFPLCACTPKQWAVFKVHSVSGCSHHYTRSLQGISGGH